MVASLVLILVAVVLLVFGLADGSSTLLISSIAASLLAAVALVAGARQVAAARATGDRAGPRAGRGFPGTSRSSAAPAAQAVAEPEIPVQHVPTTFGTGGDGWRQPPEPPVTAADGVGPWEPYAEAPWEPETVATRRAPADDDARVGESDVASARSGDGDLGGPWESVSPAPGPSWRDGQDTGSWRAEPTGDVGPDDEPEVQYVSTVDAARVARLDTEVRVVDGRPRYHLSSCPHLFGRDHEPLPVSEAVSLGFSPCADCAPDTALLADAPPS
ncbi:hypothetical protein [Micromonospora halophytica]|uniref:Clumping factor A n=1 Tax=Micromonospora halophytica TaxID=47864 RepID=A0A1C5GV22_9ACTN|nr:hypothetical protein [Micromonospora halophytica]SCG37614.1 hypothetical protein GA0070560_102141 [Micromonospora halophytica]